MGAQPKEVVEMGCRSTGSTRPCHTVESRCDSRYAPHFRNNVHLRDATEPVGPEGIDACPSDHE